MSDFQIFGLQNVLSLLVYSLIARWYVWPKLSQRPLSEALVPLLWVHAFRHVAWTLATQNQVDPRIPRDWLAQLAYGDLVSMVLALLSILALRRNFGFALGLVWGFTVVGTLDLVNVLYKSIQLDATQYHLGFAWYIATFYVPALWVTHSMIVVLLLRRKTVNINMNQR